MVLVDGARLELATSALRTLTGRSLKALSDKQLRLIEGTLCSTRESAENGQKLQGAARRTSTKCGTRLRVPTPELPGSAGGARPMPDRHKRMTGPATSPQPCSWRHVDRKAGEVRLEPGTTKNQARLLWSDKGRVPSGSCYSRFHATCRRVLRKRSSSACVAAAAQIRRAGRRHRRPAAGSPSLGRGSARRAW